MLNKILAILAVVLITIVVAYLTHGTLWCSSLCFAQAACESDTDCPAWTYCNDGSCVVSSDPLCKNNSDCGKDAVCDIYGDCVTVIFHDKNEPHDTGCKTNDDCETGERCDMAVHECVDHG